MDDLLHSPSRHFFELIIVDQSDTQCVGLANHPDPRVNYRRVPFKNLPRARNHGVAAASGDIILFLDDDVDSVTKIVDAHAAAHTISGAHVVTGPILGLGEKTVPLSAIPTADLERMRAGLALIRNVDAHYNPLFAQGCNASYRRDVILALGGFDENFIGAAIGEDAEMSHRVKMSGGSISYYPAASLVHLQAPTGGCRDEQDELRRAIIDVLNTHYFWHKVGSYRTGKGVLSCVRTYALNRRAVTSLPPWVIARRLGVLLYAWWKARRRTADLILSNGPSVELQVDAATKGPNCASTSA